MKSEVATAIEELRKQFSSAAFTVTEDGQGGARVIMEPVSVGTRLRPSSTWMGFHIPPTYPYADLYPVFIDMPTEPLKMRVHERLPEASTIQPVYVEPVTISMKSGVVAIGDP